MELRSSNEGNLDDGMVQLRGLIDITSAGWHDFNSSSDDGSVIRVGNQVVVNNDGGHGAPGPAPDGSAFFTKAGLYPIEVNWFNGDWTNDAGDHGGANIHLTMDGEALEGLLYLLGGGHHLAQPGQGRAGSCPCQRFFWNPLKPARLSLWKKTCGHGLAIARPMVWQICPPMIPWSV